MRALVLVILAACLDVPAVDPCGPMPAAPASVVSFERGMATMSASTWSAHSRWADAIQAWGDCEAAR